MPAGYYGEGSYQKVKQVATAIPSYERAREGASVSQFLDGEGRTYDIVTAGEPLFDDYVARGAITLDGWTHPHDYLLHDSSVAAVVESDVMPEDEIDLGAQLLTVSVPRLPSHVEPHMDYDHGDRQHPLDPALYGRLTLTHRATRRRCVLHFVPGATGLIHPNKNRYGFLFCQRFVVYRDTTD
jgi:hypothetical protein